MARLGILATVLAFLGGVWIFITPYVIGSQTVGTALTHSSKSFLWSGAIVAVLAAATLVAYGLMSASEAVRSAQREKLHEQGTAR